MIQPVSLLSLDLPPELSDVEQAERDRRSNTRHTMSELPWLNSARMRYGPTVVVLDLSRCGAQIETEGFRLQPGTSVVLEIAGGGPGMTIPAQVLRCQIAGISPQLTYRGALVFKSSIDLPSQLARRPDANAGDADPLQEHARLSLALKRWSESTHAGLSQSALVTSVDAHALAAALSMMHTPEARRAGPHFARELSRLFRTVSDGIDQQPTQQALLRRIANQLRRVVPAKTIRLVEGVPSALAAMSAPIWLDVPSDDETRGARLLVDVAPGSSVAEWHFQYLKAAAQLIAVVRKLSRPVDSIPAVEDRATQPSELPTGWHRVVVRYTDGRLLKGFSRDFSVSSAALEVWPAPNAPLDARITVPLAHLKAVFFVRDFAGNAEHVDDGTAGAGHGRVISVTFLDGETLTGTTLNYRSDAIGFFIRPGDAGSNNTRVFVAARGIAHVQFPSAFGISDDVSVARALVL